MIGLNLEMCLTLHRLEKKMGAKRHRKPLKLIVRILSPNGHSQRDLTFSGLYRIKLCWLKMNFELPRLNFEQVRIELWTFTVLKCFPETSVTVLSMCFLMWFGVAVQLPRLFGCVAVLVFSKVFLQTFLQALLLALHHFLHFWAIVCSVAVCCKHRQSC